MGLMRFLVPQPEQFTEEMLQLSYLSGMDRTPWLARTRAEGAELVVERDVSESGCLTVPWKVQGQGLLALSTATLLERPEPYLLPVELARGVLTQARNQLPEWQAIGLVVPDEVHQGLHDATERLSRATVAQHDPAAASASAQAALIAALDASRRLAAAYSEQMLATRRRGGTKLPTLLGGELAGPPLDDPAARQFLTAFNAAMVPMPWREIEASEGSFEWTACDQRIQWCRAHGLKVMVGPLVQLDVRSLPDWVYLWEDDLDNLLDALSGFVRAAVTRYKGKADLWLCAGRMNATEVLSLSEEEKLRLTAGVLNLVSELDSAVPSVLAIDQPWGEYLGRRHVDFPPMHFADVLARAGLNLRALMLEINLGCFRGATMPRTELELSRQLDYWSLLGLPLMVSLSVSSGNDDPLAQRQVKLATGSASPQGQHAWIARNVPLMLAKGAVQGVFWNQLRDSVPHDFPRAGLFDDRGRPKPGLRALAALRAIHLR